MKKVKICFIFLLLLFTITSAPLTVYAQPSLENISSISESKECGYNVCDENGKYLFSRTDVNIDDVYIDKDYNCYKVYLVDKEYNLAYAKLTDKISMPKIKKNDVGKISNNTSNKSIGLYMTHNDESYIIGDNTSSVYGAGGIHDISNQLKNELENHGIKVTLDETLHIPHDSKAYTRSKSTAEKLLDNNPDCIFDIHRDGVARSAYITNYDGKEKCQIRIVVGQSNPNKEKNLKFALYLMAVADELYPWLFTDIYYASGNYNQSMSNKMLLFEMGTYLVEKSLVEKSIPALADTINTTLYNTVIDEDGNITINAKETSSQQSINKALNEDKKVVVEIIDVKS